MSLKWKREAGSSEWIAHSEIDEAQYVIDEYDKHCVELFVVWGRGEMVGEEELGEYPNFEAATWAAEEAEAKERRDREDEEERMAEAYYEARMANRQSYMEARF